MAEEPTQGEKIQSPSSRGSGTPVVLNNRYHVFPANPLPAFNSPQAPAFVAEDRRDPAARLFALICDPSLLTLIDWGVVEWPLARRSCVLAVYEEPLGGRLTPDSRGRFDPVREHDVLKKVIQPFATAIKKFSDRELTHRGIRLNNVFFSDAARQQLVIGECVTAPPWLRPAGDV